MSKEPDADKFIETLQAIAALAGLLALFGVMLWASRGVPL